MFNKKVYLKTWRKNNPDKVAAQQQRARDKLKLDTLKQYSGLHPRCAKCSVEDIDLLCIDHINDGGKHHLKQIGNPSGQNFYKWLKRNNWPKGYQVLCWNCNHKKEIERRRNGST